MDTLKHAHEQARRGKGHYSAVKRVEKNVESHLLELQSMLINKTFTTGEYQIEDRMEGGKMRRIYKLPYYPDRIVQHALMSVIGPIFRRSFIRDTFQSLPMRGTSDARRRVQNMMRNDPQPYALKMDIRLYYPSVDNDKLKLIVRKKIKCKETLWLIDNIIDSMKGLPIGNLSSQYLGNIYLYEFDWWVKQSLGVSYYFRYCDDIVMFGKDKKELREWRLHIQQKINQMSLQIKPDWQIVDTRKQGIDFVGYVFYSDKTRLRRKIADNFCKHAKKAAKRKITPSQSLLGFAAYKGWLMRANCKALWRSKVSYSTVRYCDNVFKRNPIKAAL